MVVPPTRRGADHRRLCYPHAAPDAASLSARTGSFACPAGHRSIFSMARPACIARSLCPGRCPRGQSLAAPAWRRHHPLRARPPPPRRTITACCYASNRPHRSAARNAANGKEVSGGFALARDSRMRASGRHLVLIDDVHASCETLRAAARALRRSGAKRVSALTWAGVVPDALMTSNIFDFASLDSDMSDHILTG